MNKKVVVLLMGETGAGKSTFLNYTASYFLKGTISYDKKYSDLKTVVPNAIIPTATHGTVRHTEANIYDKTVSQTSKPNIYSFKGDDGLDYFIIDTPGFGDTDRSKDEKNLQNIMSTAANQPFISAIVLIINGSLSRETTSLKYIIESMKGAVPNSLLNNLVIVFTNCDETTCNFEIKLLSGLNTKKIFYMQNNCFSNNLTNAEAKTWRKLQNEFADSMDTLKELYDYVKSLTDGSAKDFAQMKIQRENLMRTANEIIADQTRLIQAIESIENYQKVMKDAKSREEANKNFMKMQKVKVKEMKKTEYFSTACSEHLNEFVCHERCGLGVQTSMNEQHFLRCAAACGKNCRVCQCPMSQHYHIFEIPVEVEKDQETIIQDMKIRFDQATNEIDNTQSALDDLEALKKKLQKAIINKKSQLEKTCRDLTSICTNFNFYEELKGIIGNLGKQAAICRDFDKKKQFETLASAIKNIIPKQ